MHPWRMKCQDCKSCQPLVMKALNQESATLINLSMRMKEDRRERKPENQQIHPIGMHDKFGIKRVLGLLPNEDYIRIPHG